MFPGVCPLLCSGHGFYGGGRCHCLDGWKGGECEVREEECEVADCSGHGDCREGVCLCRRGWTGRHCQKSEYTVTLAHGWGGFYRLGHYTPKSWNR